MVDVLDASGANKPKPGLIATPTSTISPEEMVRPQLQAAQGLRALGQSLGTLGEQIDAASIPGAQAAGLAAVGRDENGEPTVELRPFAVSGSDRAFNAAATQGFLSKYQMDTQRGLQEIAAKHASDPAAFDAEAKRYVKSLGASAKELRPLVQAEGDKLRQQHFLTIQNAAVKRQTEGAKDAILVQIDSTTNELYALARKGGVDTDEFRSASDRLSALYTDLKANPLFEVGPARADAEFQSTADRARGFAMAGEAVRIYDAQGEKEANRWLVESVRDNPNLKISDAQRSSLLEIGRNAIATRKGENKAAVDANKATAGVLAKALEDGRAVPSGSVETAIETATRLGDTETAAKLITSRQVYGRSEFSRGLSDEERVRQATSAPVAPSDMHGVITSAADRYGISHGYALRVAHIESRFDPNVINAGSGATGLFQFIPSTWRQYGGGNSARDPVANADAAMRLTIANRNQLRASLGRDPTEGELYLAHQQGAAGAGKLLAAPNSRAVDVVGERAVLGNGGTLDMTAGQFAQLWIRKVDGAAGGNVAVAPAMRATPFTQQELAANPYLGSAWLRAQMTGNKELIDSAKYVMSAASNAIDKGRLPDAQTLAGALQIADQNPTELGRDRDELVAKIRGDDAGEEINRSGTAVGAQLLQDALRKAQGTPIFVQMQAEAMKAAVERGAKNLKEQPWDEAARRGWSPAPLPMLDATSAANFEAGLAARLSVANAITARTGLPQLVLSGDDVAAVRGIMATGLPAQRDLVATQLARLPDEQFNAVITNSEMRDSLIGMSRSGDPTKMAPAFALMDRAQRSDPDGFSKAYGRDVENRLAAWTSRMAYMAPEELAREMQRENDPSMKKVRDELRSQGEEKVKKLTASDIAGYFDVSWAPFTAPGAPAQPEASARFAADYKAEFAETFAAIGDESKARELTVQRLGRVWAPSVVNGGRLTKFAPEKSTAYPAINGSHDWLAKQLDDDIRAVLRIDAPNVGWLADRGFHPKSLTVEEIGRATAILSAPRMLVPDARTEAEFNAGKAPSYPVVVKAPNGMYMPLMDARGEPLRFVGNDEAAMAPVRAGAEAERAYRSDGIASMRRVQERDMGRWRRTR